MTNNTPATEVAATEVAPAAPVLDDFGQMAVTKLVTQITERNSHVDKLLAVGGDRISMLDDYRERVAAGENVAGLAVTADQISKVQEKLAELLETRDKALNAQVDADLANADIDPAALTEVVKALDTSIKQGLNYATGLYGDGVKSLLPDIKPLKGTRSASGGGTGQRRLRGFTVSVDGIVATTPDKDGKQRSSFSAAAKVLGHKSVETVSNVYASVAGTDPDKYPSSCAFKVADKEGVEREVIAVRDAE